MSSISCCIIGSKYSQVLELAKSLQVYKQCGIIKKVHIGFS